MKTLITAAAFSLLSLPTAAFAETKTYALTGFDQIDTSAGIEVEFTAGPKYSVVAEIIAGDPERVKIEMKGSLLILSHKSGIGRQKRQETLVKVTGPSLSALRASSGSTLNATGLAATALDVNVSSGATARISGTCDTLTLGANSGGSAKLKDMVCKTVNARASSGGSADATATLSATGNASSGGSIDIWGNPASRKANKSMSGGSTTFR